MSYGREEDPNREYEMIWTLFQGTEEEEVPKKSKEGVTVKILKFLFGSGGGEKVEEILDDYREKKRFHRHVYQPSPRHAGTTVPPGGINDAQEGKNWTQQRLEASADFPLPGPTASGFLYQNLCRILVAATLASMVLLLSSASNCLETIKSIATRNQGSDED